MSNIVNAHVRGAICGTTPLYQYDYGQILKIHGVELPDAYEVHFSNTQNGNATVSIGNEDGVEIPDIYLQSGDPIYAWIYLHTGEDDGETKYLITIPVIARAAFTNETPTPVQQDTITQAIAALNNGVQRAKAAADGIEQTVAVALTEAKESGEFDGPQGETGPAGAPGISPSITITDITGGHRVTITDATGAHSFDVMDGESGSGSDIFIAEYNVTTYAELLAAFNDGEIIICKCPVSRETIYLPLYSFHETSGFYFTVRGTDSSLGTYRITCSQRYGWSRASEPYNAITSVGTVEEGDYLAFVDANSSNRLTRSNSLTFGTDSGKYLANDGTWQDVPSGWDVMLGLSGIIAPVEDSTASKAYAIGDAFLHGGALYKASAAIAEGDAIVPETNCTQTTIIEMLKGA